MRILKLFQSTAFRLALLYMALFSVSVSLLLTFIYFETSKEMDGQIKQTINSQVGELTVTFYQDGVQDTVNLIGDMIQHDTERMALYLLMDKKKRILAGNVKSWPEHMQQEGKWYSFTLPNPAQEEDEDTIQVLARSVALKGGHKLLVGYNLRHVEGIRSIIQNVLLGCLGLTFLVAIASAFVVTHVISQRLERVNQACKRVMSGNLDEKIPLPGGADAFDTLAENFNAMLTWIGALIKGIQEVSHNIAHDLRSPLTRLRNRLQNIADSEPSPDTLYDEIRIAIGEIDTLIHTFNAILRISQAEARAGIEHFAPFDVSVAVHTITDFYLPLIEEKGLTLESHIAPNVELHGDKHLIMQALANLLDNAIKYTPYGGHITLNLSATEQQLTISIADTGGGIPEEYHEKVKERFFRLDSSRSTQGSGLGLSLVDAVIKQHQGQLGFTNMPEGLLVTVVLPRFVR